MILAQRPVAELPRTHVPQCRRQGGAEGPEPRKPQSPTDHTLGVALRAPPRKTLLLVSLLTKSWHCPAPPPKQGNGPYLSVAGQQKIERLLSFGGGEGGGWFIELSVGMCQIGVPLKLMVFLLVSLFYQPEQGAQRVFAHLWVPLGKC